MPSSVLSSLTANSLSGIVKGFPYTATLYVGDQCGGVATWSQDACVGLFKDFVDTRCEAQYPAGDDLFERKYCDVGSEMGDADMRSRVSARDVRSELRVLQLWRLDVINHWSGLC